MSSNNQFILTRKVAMKVLDSLLNRLNVVDKFNTDWVSEFGAKAPQKIGQQLKITRPFRWTSTNGAQAVPQAMNQQYVDLVIDNQKNIAFDYSKWTEALELDDIYDRCFKPGVDQLANDFDDAAALYAYQNTNNYQGALGTDPASLADSQAIFLQSRAGLTVNSCTPGDVGAVLGPVQSAILQQYLNLNFNPQNQLGDQWKKGMLLPAFGYDTIQTDANIRNHQSGTFTGTPAVNGSLVDGATTIVSDAWTAGDTLLKGDIIAVAATNNVNPVNRRSTGVLKRLLVTADAVADGGGNMTIQVSCGGADPLYGAGNQYQNVDALPVDNALITVWPGTSTPSGKRGVQGLALGRQAFIVATTVFPDPSKEGAWGSTVRDPKTGIAITMAKQFQIMPYETIARLDIGFGFGPGLPDNDSYRLVGA